MADTSSTPTDRATTSPTDDGGSADADELDGSTRSELYELARHHDVDGRSSMTKADLIEALAPILADAGTDSNGAGQGAEPGAEPSGEATTSRFQAFARLARARAAGEFLALPRNLTGEERRLHVRQTIREDHETRIAERSEDAETKFGKLAGSRFAFFRGTALLFYRDLAGDDARMPTVLALGDVHPENFGVMPSADNVPIFGVNDFDEAYYAPFTWDLKRGAVGFWLAADEIGGQKKKRRRKIVKRFVEGYLDGIETFAADDFEMQRQVRLDNAPDLVADLIDDVLDSRDAWLADEYHGEYRRGFRTDDELIPITSRRDEFQEIVDRWIEGCGIDVPPRAGDMKVKDVSIRRGQGTASLGLSRYYVLIEGERADASDDLVIEFKRARRSALAGLVPPSRVEHDGRGERIAHAQGVQLVRADPFYGSVDIDGQSFMSRERAPYRDDIDLDDLSKKEWRRYAAICGRALAQAHALSDDIGDIDGDVEERILDSVANRELFIDDLLRFTEEAVDRLTKDHEHFRADHEMEAFRSIDVWYH